MNNWSGFMASLLSLWCYIKMKLNIDKLGFPVWWDSFTAGMLTSTAAISGIPPVFTGKLKLGEDEDQTEKPGGLEEVTDSRKVEFCVKSVCFCVCILAVVDHSQICWVNFQSRCLLRLRHCIHTILNATLTNLSTMTSWTLNLLVWSLLVLAWCRTALSGQSM